MPPPNAAPFYDGVGSVKRHEECASHGGSFSLHLKGTLLFLSSTKARFVNPAVESGSTNHLFGLPCARSSFVLQTPRSLGGARCPIKFTVYLRAPGCPAGCLACEPAVRNLLHYAASSTYARPTCARWPLWPPRVLFGTSTADSPAAERDRTALLFALPPPATSAAWCCPAC